MMVLGFQRTLQASDLWRMGPEQEAGYLSDKLETAWARRVEAAAAWNKRLESGEAKPGLVKRVRWALSGKRAERERKWREEGGRREASLAWALNDVLGHLFWKGGLFKVRPLVHVTYFSFLNRTYAPAGRPRHVPAHGPAPRQGAHQLR